MTGFPTHSRGNADCALRAFGVAEATPETLRGLRKQPGPPDGWPTPANILNHSEDQTVVALSAVLHAIHAGGLHEQVFTDWAVVGSPRFPGRLSFAGSLNKYRRMGALSVSPSIIPFLSLHAVSSMVSLALHSHGPSLGVGGGKDGIIQALLLAVALQQEKDLPGVWVVVTGWDPEPVPEPQADAPQPVCRAAALALLPGTAGAHGSRLRIVPGVENGTEGSSAPSLVELVRVLSGGATARRPQTWSCAGPGSCRLELTVESPGQDLSLLARSA